MGEWGYANTREEYEELSTQKLKPQTNWRREETLRSEAIAAYLEVLNPAKRLLCAQITSSPLENVSELCLCGFCS